MVPPRMTLPVETVVNRYLADESIMLLESCYQVSQQTIRQLLVGVGITIRARRHRVPLGSRPWTPQGAPGPWACVPRAAIWPRSV